MAKEQNEAAGVVSAMTAAAGTRRDGTEGTGGAILETRGARKEFGGLVAVQRHRLRGAGALDRRA